MSKVIVVIGAQWGDEGKGKIVDLLAEQFDIVARYQGGHNAGHSVQVGDKSFVLHLLPSGIVHRGKTCVLGNGMVIDPKAFFDEADRLTAARHRGLARTREGQFARASDSSLPSRSRPHQRRTARQRKGRHDAARHRSGV